MSEPIADQLDPYVRSKYAELWRAAQQYDMVEESEFRSDNEANRGDES